jgi:hypothetical protein
MEVFAFNASAQAVMPALSFIPNILLSEASSVDNAPIFLMASAIAAGTEVLTRMRIAT